MEAERSLDTSPPKDWDWKLVCSLATIFQNFSFVYSLQSEFTPSTLLRTFGILTTMSFKEALATPNEVITVLASAEDEEVLGKVAKIYNEVQEEQSLQLESVKSTLRALSKILADKEEEEKASRINENSNGVQTLQVERDATVKHIEKLEADVKVFEKKVTGKEDEIKELMEKATEVKTNSVEILPQTKYNFSLYTNVSHIRWDYECDDDQVKGFIANLNDVKPFCFSKREKSKFDIVNILWDLLEA